MTARPSSPSAASPVKPGLLGRLLVTTLAYAVAVTLVALALPTILTPVPLAAVMPEPPPVVARTPVSPVPEIAP